MLASHTTGYAFQATFGIDLSDKHYSEVADRLPQMMHDVPRVARLAPLIIECSWDTEFLFGLEIILDGLEARLGPSG